MKRGTARSPSFEKITDLIPSAGISGLMSNFLWLPHILEIKDHDDDDLCTTPPRRTGSPRPPPHPGEVPFIPFISLYDRLVIDFPDEGRQSLRPSVDRNSITGAIIVALDEI